MQLYPWIYWPSYDPQQKKKKRLCFQVGCAITQYTMTSGNTKQESADILDVLSIHLSHGGMYIQ